jgi:thioredoxin 1
MAEVAEVNDKNFEAEVLRSSTPAIVDFWAEWCAPCRQIAPIIKELAGKYDGKVKIVKLDVDANPATAGRYGVSSIPTVLAISGGRVVQQLVGARPKADFESMIQKLLA